MEVIACDDGDDYCHGDGDAVDGGDGSNAYLCCSVSLAVRWPWC